MNPELILNFAGLVNQLNPYEFQSLVNYLIWRALLDPEENRLEGQIRQYATMGPDGGIDGRIFGKLHLAPHEPVDGQGVICAQHISGITADKSSYLKAKPKLEEDLAKLLGMGSSECPDFVIFATAAPLLPQQEERLEDEAEQLINDADAKWGEAGKVFVAHFEVLKSWCAKYLGESASDAFSHASGIWLGANLVRTGYKAPEKLPIPAYRKGEDYFNQLFGREEDLKKLDELIHLDSKKGIILHHTPFAGATAVVFELIKGIVKNPESKHFPIYVQANAPEPSEKTRNWLSNLPGLDVLTVVFLECSYTDNKSLKSWLDALKPTKGKKGKLILIGHDIRIDDMKNVIGEWEPNPVLMQMRRLPKEPFFDFLEENNVYPEYQGYISQRCDQLPGMLELLLNRPHPSIADELVRSSIDDLFELLQKEYARDIGLNTPRTKQLLALIALLQPINQNIEGRKPTLQVICDMMKRYKESPPSIDEIEHAIQKLIKKHILELRSMGGHYSQGLVLSPRPLALFIEHLKNFKLADPIERAAELLSLMLNNPETVCNNLTYVSDIKEKDGYITLKYPLLEEVASMLLTACSDYKLLSKMRRTFGTTLYNVLEQLV